MVFLHDGVAQRADGPHLAFGEPFRGAREMEVLQGSGSSVSVEVKAIRQRPAHGRLSDVRPEQGA